MLDAKAVGKMLGIAPHDVYGIQREQLPRYELGRRGGAIRYDPKDVEAYQARKVKPLPSPRVLREYERMRLLAVKAGAEGLPELSESERAAIAKRVRNERTPPWADRKAIRAIYAEAKHLSTETGIAHHVDHEIPLLGSVRERPSR